MAEGQNTTEELLEGLEVVITEDPDGLQFYHVIDHEDLDPNGEPVIYELTASEYLQIKSKL
jgi:hypothetical protein